VELRLNAARAAVPAVLRVAVRASGLERPAWLAEMLRRLRAVPGAEIVETHEPRPLIPADVYFDPNESALSVQGELHPPLGHWRFVYGPEGRLRDPCTHEHAAGERGAMVRLVAIAADGHATQLEAGVIKAVTHSLSATRARMLEAVVDWPARALRRILDSSSRELRGPHVEIAAGDRASPPAAPSVFDGARAYARRFAREAIEEHWTVGVIRKPVHHVIDSFDANDIQWLTLPPGWALADPCGGIERNGRLTVLAEAYDFSDRQGRIVAFDVQDARIVSPPREVLRLPVHVSYPHLIFHGTHIYCLPETSANGRVQLYRADPFPDRWVPDRVLLESFAGADATVHRHHDRWWMFVGNHADQDETKLYIFHAPDLFGPWQPHALNPVKCDLRSSRPAGPLFEHTGQLYRPAQDGSLAYGGAVAVNRVITLTPTAFEEATVAILRPSASNPYPHGLHTLTGVGAFTLVDGKRHVRSLKRFVWGLKQMAPTLP
jgi:hypothetical protein